MATNKVKSTTVDFGQSQMNYPAPSKENNYLGNFGFKNGFKPNSAGTKGSILPKKTPMKPLKITPVPKKPSDKPIKKIVPKKVAPDKKIIPSIPTKSKIPTYRQIASSVRKTMGHA